MKTKIFLITLSLLATLTTIAQEPFEILIEPMSISGAPGVHSFSWGKTSDGKWIIIGGRIDGLHERQPFAAFLESSNNTDISIIDPVSNQVWSTSLNTLPASIFEQLQSTNQEFYQRENNLYVIGGYGYSATAADHITYGNLTAIDVDGVANAVINNAPINSYFRQISDTNLAVTGGQIGMINSTFYLCGGQYFEGRYNPQGPNHGPGFIQEYTDEIRSFNIMDNGTTLSITNYNATNNVDQLHRRDYNMSPQVFPNGTVGLTIFSGVFDPNDLPYLNTVDVFDTGYAPNNTFNQYLSQYHSAKLPIYDNSNQSMHTIFFGGMSQFTLDSSGNLVQDDNVPFVKTISKVTRLNNGSMTESELAIEMPTLLGSGAEFIPISNTNYYLNDEIVKLNNLPIDSVLVGYIYGGIESTLPNIFFINNGTQSSASSQVFKVYINKNVTSIEQTALEGTNIFNVEAFPNPSNGNFSVSYTIPSLNTHKLKLYDLNGSLVKNINLDTITGKQTLTLDWEDLSAGEYILILTGNNEKSQITIIIQ